MSAVGLRVDAGAALLLAAVLCACSPEASTPAASAVVAASTPQFPEFDNAHLQQGRAVWMGTCRGCHDIGIAGAPPLGDRAAWAPRIAQGRAVLHAHAREGFFGPAGTMMPVRGGNEALSDAELFAAVDYMVAASGGDAPPAP